MQNRMKYPLTDNAKEIAKELVELWENNPENQLWNYTARWGDGKILTEYIRSAKLGKLKQVSGSVLRELSKYGLVQIVWKTSDSFELLLLQELQNAVKNDFSVSDYFLTLNAVGNIFMMAENSTVSNVVGGASNFGDVTQTQTVGAEIADELVNKLGEEFLKSHETLATAIQNLRNESPATLRQNLGKVIQQFGNSLGHGANTVTIVQALLIVLPHLIR